MSAPTPRTSRRINPGRARRGAARRHHRAVQLARGPALDAWLKSHNLPGICRRRHARDHAPHPRRRRAERRRRPCAGRQVRHSGADRRRRATGPASTAWTSRTRSPAARPISWDETTWALGKGYGKLDKPQLPRRRRRLRRQAQHPALPRHHRLQGDGRAGDGDGRGHPAPQARRRVPVERPGRSGGDRRLCRAGDPGRARQQGADLRHLPRPSDAGAGPGRQDARRCSAAIAAPTSRSRT